MKQLFGLLVLGASLSLMQSCSKSSDTSSTLVGDWVKRGDFDGVSRSEAVSVTVGDKVYAGLGYDGTVRLTDFWWYDGTADQWHRVKDFPGIARSAAVAFTSGDKVYVGLGNDGVNRLKDFWQYDPSTDSWKQLADFAGSARQDARAFSIADNGYVLGGYDGTDSKELWQYNASTDTWTQKNGPGSKCAKPVVFVINDKAYMATGSSNGSNITDFYEYDGGKDIWTAKNKIANVSDDSFDDAYNIIRYGAVAFVIDGKGYITTGVNGSYTATTWVYDPTTDLWAQKTSFQGSPREGANGFTVNNRGYIAFGRSSTLRFYDVREFLPSAESNTLND